MHSFIQANFPAIDTSSPDVLRVSPDISIGIEEVRRIQQFLTKKPTASDHNTVIVDQAHLLTLPAQQALLKTLEEPPSDSKIYLITTQPDLLLPTVLSRCQLTTSSQPAITTVDESTRQLVNSLANATGVGERISLLNEQDFTRDNFLKFLDSLEQILHQQINSGSPTTLNYSLLTETRKYLKSNSNLRLITTFFSSCFSTAIHPIS